MTRIAHLLEDFTRIIAPENMPDPVLDEDRRLQVFEDGYSAGWTDAAKAYSDDRTRADMTIAAAVADMAFTFQEAQTAMLQAMEPFIRQIVDSVLPDLARETIGLQVHAALMAAVTHPMPHEAIISAPQDTLDAIRRALPDPLPLPLRFVPDAALADGQVILRIGSREQEIHPDQMLSQIRDAVAAFFAPEPKEARYG